MNNIKKISFSIINFFLKEKDYTLGTMNVGGFFKELANVAIHNSILMAY